MMTIKNKPLTLATRPVRRPSVFGMGANLAIVAVLAGGCGSEASKEATAAPAVEARVSRAVRVERAGEVEIYGIVESDRTAAVSARVMAMVTSVSVRPGDRVRRGQVLLEIDPQTAQGQLGQARGALMQARAALTLAERNFERFQALVDTAAASQIELDTARMHYEQAEGAVEQAEGAVRAASSVASDARVAAPFDARVVRRMVEVGDLAAPGRPLLLLEAEHGRRLSIEVPESLAGRVGLEPGRILRVAIDTRPDLGEFEAPVVEVAPGVDPTSHTRTTKIDLAIEGLASGISGRAWLPTERRTLVAVPREAIIERGGLALAIVLTEEGLAATRVVTLGRTLAAESPEATTAELIEVLSGLSGEEQVLVGLTAPPPAGTRVDVRP